MRHGSRGSVLLEAAVVLVTAAALYFVLGRTLASAAGARDVARRVYRDTYAFLRMRRLLEQISEDLDSHPFEIVPLVHADGRILFRDGEAPAFTAGRHAPSAGSDAVTALKLALAGTYQIVGETYEGGAVNLYGCPRYDGPARADPDISYLGISPDGLWELCGESRQHPGRAGCRDFHLAASRSMSVTPPFPEPLGIRILIPIVRHYTLYIDGAGQMRWVTHACDALHENQPLFRNVKGIRLHQRGMGGALCLEARLTFHDESSREATACNSLGRSDYLNFLFNRR